MERLNKALVPQVKRPQNIRVMQFGEGGFLRAFVDEMLDNLNTQCGGDYGVAIVQPLERGMCQMLRDQDCLYTVMLSISVIWCVFLVFVGLMEVHDYSPGKTFVFLIVILGVTDGCHANGKFGGLAIGLTLVLIHLISIPLTNTSVNPARSISQAIFAGGSALSHLWLFIVAPLVGAGLAGLAYKGLCCCKKDK